MPRNFDDLPALMTVAEVAEALRISDETVHRWCREGRLAYVNMLGLKRFHRDYIAELVAGPTATALLDAGSSPSAKG